MYIYNLVGKTFLVTDIHKIFPLQFCENVSGNKNFFCLIYQVEDLSREPLVERELLLIKLNADPSTKAEVIT